MPRGFRSALVSFRDLALSLGPFLVLALVLLALAFWYLKPTPPKTVVLATGPEQSDFAEFGKRYATELKKYGIAVELRTTQGSAENLRLLNDAASGVQVAFVLGGSSDKPSSADDAEADTDLVSLGNLFYEPVWVFYRQEALREKAKGGKSAVALTNLTQLKGLRVNLGAQGSGATNLVKRLLRVNRIEANDFTASELEMTPAVVALLGGELDALIIVSAQQSPMVRMLLRTPGIGLADFVQADAYARRLPVVESKRLIRGIVALGEDVPPRDVQLIAATATLVAREDVHPALMQLLVQAARRIHGRVSWFNDAGQFPNGSVKEFPLAPEAERFYRNGIPLLQRHLPFWLANLIDRMWVAMLTILAALIPLSKVIPPLYRFRIRSRIFRWYRQLREIEDIAVTDAKAAPLLERLNALEARVERVQVPLAYADELYALRSHIDLVRARLSAPSAGEKT